MVSSARAIVVINESIADDELKAMDALGVRGIRFNISRGTSKDPAFIMTLAQRGHPLGWHVHFWMSADDTVAMEDLLHRLPTPIVFDHRGHIPQPEGIAHPAFRTICGLIEKGNRAAGGGVAHPNPACATHRTE